MIDNACSRREFLKNFSLLSGGALMLSVTSIGCGGGTKNMLPSVIGMCFYDEDIIAELRGNQTVPVQTRFVIYFSTDMNTGTMSTKITFADSNSKPIVFTKTWDDTRTLILTPSTDLSPSMNYTLTVNDAIDSNGHTLNEYANASAAFRTVSV